ncbi:MAG: sigma 54-interacting transcriptional regulator [Immundisolibacteraceae bacterium]|nr:sigma 54-interacting transcriptional regulator [Immundisolibacteraceae bacterium]
MTEITEQNLDNPAELARLLDERARILEAAGEGIYGIDCQGLGTFANPAAIRILGWTPDQLVGQPVHQLHHHSHADGTPYPREQCPIYAALQDGKVHHEENEVFWHADGSCVPVEYTSTPIRDGDGNQLGAVVVFRDISERKQAQREQQIAYAQIESLKNELQRERDYLREEVKVAHNFHEIVGNSDPLKRLLSQIEAVAATPANALILGETGVGKELVARAIHAASDRVDGPLVKVNCASIPKDLFESEFFGHVKGAFTGALRDRVGRFELAEGGTLFLDEVGEVPLEQQGKLLRALQEKEFERVGEAQTHKVNVRIIAATNRDLREEAEAGRFRQDLYFRLSVFPIEVPTLRERKQDVVPLVHNFLQRICADFGRPLLALSSAQANRLIAYDWPGNVRELQNVIERAVILSRGDRLMLDSALPELNLSSPSGQAPLESSTLLADSGDTQFVTLEVMKQRQRDNIIGALMAAGWRVSGDGGAAELLGVKPTTLAYQMKRLAIKKGDGQQR